MAVKTNQLLKKQKKAEKKAKIDKITNWFMINLAWGIFGFIILRYMSNPIATDYNEFIDGQEVVGPVKSFLGTFAIILGIIAILLLVWGLLTKFNVIKCPANPKSAVKKLFANSQRFINYGVFAAVLTVVTYYLSIYNKVRMYVLNAFPSLWESTTFSTQEFWISGGISYAIGAYLLVAFIYTAVKVALIQKKK